MKTIKLAVASLVLSLGLAMAYEPTPTLTVEVKDREPVVSKVDNKLSSGKVKSFKNTYVFGSVGTTVNGKSSTVTSVGLGHDFFHFMDGHLILGGEVGLTHFTGKRLDTINNDGTEGFANVDKKNLLEVGDKLSYQFNETDPLNVRLYGKAGVATTTLKKGSQLSPYFAVGTEFNVNNSNFVWFGEVKHYTDLRKAKVYYAEDSGSNFNTRKDNTTFNVGLQYRF